MGAQGISIVIPAFNEEKFLPATIEAAKKACAHFANQVSLPTEIVVVNNISTDKTESLALSLGAVVENHHVRNISSVRNAGIKRASFDLIVTIDADSFLPEDGLVKVWETMKGQKYVGGAFGVKLLTNKLKVKFGAFIIQSLVEIFFGIQGAMFFFWKEAALEVGGFPEDRLVAEDSAFAILLKNHGRKIGKKFIILKSVQVTTLDRKEIGFRSAIPIIGQVIRGFAGVKQTKEDLKYWYDPKR